MVGGGDEAAAVADAPILQRGITRGAGGGLQTIAGCGDVYREGCMGDAACGADIADEARFAGGFGAQAVIDGRGGDLAGKGGMREEEERQAVRPPGYRQPDPRVGIAGEGEEIGAEAGGGVRGEHV